jgi:hypothetical protein
MICETCRGRGFTPLIDQDEPRVEPCSECQGSGVTSCCDAAGASNRAEKINMPHYAAAYSDDTYPERLCDYCGTLYRGPAVYCSLECALEDR